MINDEFEMVCKEAVVAYSRNYPKGFLEELGKTTKNLSQDGRPSGRATALLVCSDSRLMQCERGGSHI
jgi:hypothetical protein